jgi:SAM-dependent methyltransferase
MTPNLFSLDPLFRYASCEDLIALKVKFPHFCHCEPDSLDSMTWGLKEMGRLFCIDLMQQLDPGRALEVGAGGSTFFDEAVGQTWESWMIDKPGYYPKEQYELWLKNRKHTKSVEGFMGEFSDELRTGFFDLVYSVSVLEHAPLEDLDLVYADMYRVLKPDGFMVHSIDTSDLEAGYRHFETIRKAGFAIPEMPDLTINVRRTDNKPATLFEPFAVVFCNYSGRHRPDMWTRLVPVPTHYTTILVIAKK